MKIISKLLVATACLGALAAVPASASVTIGNPATNAGTVDGCVQCTFVLNQGFGVAGLKVGNYSFYGMAPADITPLLFTRSDAGTTATFTIVGIGQLQNATAGVNTFNFALTSGTDITSANTYFGFAYTHGGVVSYNHVGSPNTDGTFVGPNNFAAGLGASFSDSFATQPADAYDALNSRTYSINVTAVPEPATWAMMLMGFGLIGAGVRSRKRETVTVTYA